MVFYYACINPGDQTAIKRQRRNNILQPFLSDSLTFCLPCIRSLLVYSGQNDHTVVVQHPNPNPYFHTMSLYIHICIRAREGRAVDMLLVDPRLTPGQMETSITILQRKARSRGRLNLQPKAQSRGLLNLPNLTAPNDWRSIQKSQ